MASEMTAVGWHPRPLLAWFVVGLLGVAFASPAVAENRRRDQQKSGLRYGFEVKGHYRESDPWTFPVNFNFPGNALPPGESAGFLSTVEAGEHTEVSAATVWLEADFWSHFSAKAKVDVIDRHDRNPTSSDREIDIDELWLRWGDETLPATLPQESFGGYVKVGKFAKFERQNDRHLESYGLVSTAFNRAEDVGVEIGFDLWRWLYAKVSYTQGNPVFLRDPNALAGDNGVPGSDFRDPDFVANPVPELGTGVPILYDADVDDFDFENIETGIGLGFRLGNDSGSWGLDVLGWAYERELADEVDLNGTFYGGDLDLLRGPENLFPLPITHTQKQEVGANLWLYAGDFTLFAQYVDQDLAGLKRTGLEAEVSYTFEMPYLGALGGRQLFSFIQPAVRYSELDNDFIAPDVTPAPSLAWDWEKLDVGLRLGLVDRLLDLTVEWNENEFILKNGRAVNVDEFLATVRWEMDWGS